MDIASQDLRDLGVDRYKTVPYRFEIKEVS